MSHRTHTLRNACAHSPVSITCVALTTHDAPLGSIAQGWVPQIVGLDAGVIFLTSIERQRYSEAPDVKGGCAGRLGDRVWCVLEFPSLAAVGPSHSAPQPERRR